MPPYYFDKPMLEVPGAERRVSIADTPYFFNEDGHPAYLPAPPADVTPLAVPPTDPELAMGHEVVVDRILQVKNMPPSGVATEFGLVAERVPFEPLWATRIVAAAFGIVLVEPGQCVKISSPHQDLAEIQYEYGVFAGHWSPYQGTDAQLLSVVCTDLEHHDFPHVFAATDPELPLVTSVGRYWPALGKLRLADLWVPPHSALYIPPKPAVSGQPCIDLHNNRNSALACWGNIRRSSVHTTTLLFQDGYFYWYWNALDTLHTRPVGALSP